MSSDVEICNRALQKIGAARIVSLTENSKNARECNACYDALRQAELRKNFWSFAIKRAQLAKDATAPDWGKAYSYTLPADFICLADNYPELNSPYLDFEIEGRQIFTNMTDPLQIRYISDIRDANLMDPLFREALASKIADEICEIVTQSNAKKQTAMIEYENAIAEAKARNGIEKIDARPPEDIWVTVRQ